MDGHSAAEGAGFCQNHFSHVNERLRDGAERKATRLSKDEGGIFVLCLSTSFLEGAQAGKGSQACHRSGVDGSQNARAEILARFGAIGREKARLAAINLRPNAAERGLRAIFCKHFGNFQVRGFQVKTRHTISLPLAGRIWRSHAVARQESQPRRGRFFGQCAERISALCQRAPWKARRWRPSGPIPERSIRELEKSIPFLGFVQGSKCKKSRFWRRPPDSRVVNVQLCKYGPEYYAQYAERKRAQCRMSRCDPNDPNAPPLEKAGKL